MRIKERNLSVYHKSLLNLNDYNETEINLRSITKARWF